MTTKSHCLLASATFALLICLPSCGKKEVSEPEPAAGAQSAHGKMLEAAQKTADDANARTERVEEAAK